MFGASLLKLLKFGFSFTGTELMILIVGMVVAFVVSYYRNQIPDGIHQET